MNNDTLRSEDCINTATRGRGILGRGGEGGGRLGLIGGPGNSCENIN